MYSTTCAPEVLATPPACTIWCEEHEHGRFDEACNTTKWVLTPSAHRPTDPGRLRVSLSQSSDKPVDEPDWHRFAPVIMLEADVLQADGTLGRAGGDLTLAEARALVVKMSQLIGQAELGEALR
jgi:hypothetical protein